MARLIAGGAAAATLALGAPSRARADAPCAAVQASPSLASEWSAAVSELTHQIAQLPASDCQPMTLTIERAEPVERGVRVAAVATDGRRTERLVLHPQSLVATALGLVMAIPPAPPASSTPTPGLTSTEGSRPAAPPPLGPTASHEPSAAPPGGPQPASPAPVAPVPAAPARVALWVGMEAGGRIAQPTSISMADVAVDGTVLLEPWLISVAIRSAPFGLLSAQGLDRDAFRQVSFGLGAGRRVHAGDAVLDVIVEPAVTSMRMEYDFSNGAESRGEDVELSVDAVVRMGLPVSKGWALTLTLEGDAIPGNVGNAPARIDVPSGQTGQTGQTALPPAFPAWQAALRLGIMAALP